MQYGSASLENDKVAIMIENLSILIQGTKLTSATCPGQFTRQLLGRGCNVHATARKPDEAKGLQGLATEKLTVGQLDTADPDSIQKWAKKLKGQPKFDVSSNSLCNCPVPCLDAEVSGVFNWQSQCLSLPNIAASIWQSGCFSLSMLVHLLA